VNTPTPDLQPAEHRTTVAHGLWTAADILCAEFPEPCWVVPGIIPTGFTLLAGRSKLGKSWLDLQVALATATGGSTLGTGVPQGKVLVLALEDTLRRLQSRMNAQGWPQTSEAVFRNACTPAELPGLIDHTGATLVVIDTLAVLFRGYVTDWSDNAQVTNHVKPLQQLAGDQDIGIIGVFHHSKAADGDVVTDVLGATALPGVADTILGLYRQRGERDARLKVTGRDVEEHELALRWNAFDACWSVVGEAESGMHRKHAPEIVAFLIANPRKTLSQVAKGLGLSKASVSRVLGDLANNGRVVLADDGTYTTVPDR
jgi:hypothetical protein